MKRTHRTYWTGLFAAMCVALTLAIAQEEAGSSADAAQGQLMIAEDPVMGQFLTDAAGQSLYTNLDSRNGTQACTDSCLQYWPPFNAGETPGVAEGLDASLVGMTPDAEGEPQITYNGWPLFYSRSDRSPGNIRGHEVGDVWFLMSPAGEPIKQPDEQAAEETVEGVPPPVEARTQGQIDELFTEYMADGKAIYLRSCASCHSEGGEGGVGIRLINNPLLADAHDIADAVTNGRGYMPPFKAVLSDAQIAAALTFVRNSWENDYGVLEEAEVAKVREQ